MTGYIGSRYKERRKRRLYYIVFIVLIFFFVYYIYFDDENDKSIINQSLSDGDFTTLKENSISLDEHKLEIIEKDNQINSLMKKNKLLSESMDLLNFNLERNLEDFKEIANTEIKEANAKNNELQKELENLNSSILALKNEYKEMSNGYLKINLELKQSEKKLLQTKERLREKDIIIEKLKGKIHH